MSSDATLAYATFPDENTADRVCRTLVEERVIRCANILPPHRSIYVWNDEINDDREVGAILKLGTQQRATLEQRFRALHPYDTPALVYLAVDGGLEAFLSWLEGK